MKRLLLLILSSFLFFSASSHAEEPLPADEVFKLSTEVQDASHIIATWKITPGYYLYKDRINIKACTIFPEFQVICYQQ